MKLLSKIWVAAAVCTLGGLLPAQAEAAALNLNGGPIKPPADWTCSSSASGGNDLTFLSGSCGVNTTGFVDLYGHDDPSTESGSFSGSYSTSVSATDPQTLVITYTGGSFISCGTCWLVIKDGGVADPNFLGWNLSNPGGLAWDGTGTITVTGLYPFNGSYSHVSILGVPGGSGGGGGGTGGGGGILPEPASLSLFGLAMVGAAWRARKRRVG